MIRTRFRWWRGKLGRVIVNEDRDHPWTPEQPVMWMSIIFDQPNPARMRRWRRRIGRAVR